MAKLVARGVNSFKFFFAYKGSLAISDALFLKGLLRCKDLGALPMVRSVLMALNCEVQIQILRCKDLSSLHMVQLPASGPGPRMQGSERGTAHCFRSRP